MLITGVGWGGEYFLNFFVKSDMQHTLSSVPPTHEASGNQTFLGNGVVVSAWLDKSGLNLETVHVVSLFIEVVPSLGTYKVIYWVGDGWGVVGIHQAK